MITEETIKGPQQVVQDERSATERNLDEAANVHYLSPGDYKLFRSPGGSLRLTLGDERSVLRAKTRRCFPITYPTRFISLRDSSDEEIGIISDLADLDKEHQLWILDDLELAYYTPRVSSILTLKQRWGGMQWIVATDRGEKRFITRGVHDTLCEVDRGRYIITDVDGNRYEIAVCDLDDSSRAKIDRMI